MTCHMRSCKYTIIFSIQTLMLFQFNSLLINRLWFRFDQQPNKEILNLTGKRVYAIQVVATILHHMQIHTDLHSYVSLPMCHNLKSLAFPGSDVHHTITPTLQLISRSRFVTAWVSSPLLFCKNCHFRSHGLHVVGFLQSS